MHECSHGVMMSPIRLLKFDTNEAFVIFYHLLISIDVEIKILIVANNIIVEALITITNISHKVFNLTHTGHWI